MKTLRKRLVEKLGVEIEEEYICAVLDSVRQTICAFEDKRSMIEFMKDVIEDMQTTGHYDMCPVAIADFESDKIFGVFVLEKDHFLEGIYHCATPEIRA